LQLRSLSGIIFLMNILNNGTLTLTNKRQYFHYLNNNFKSQKSKANRVKKRQFFFISEKFEKTKI
jgi:hypothetical protein